MSRDNDRLSRENNELQNRCINDESRVRSTVEEVNFLKERIKTLTFENQQLKTKKEEIVKKMSDQIGAVADASSVRTTSNLTSTIRSNKHQFSTMPSTPKASDFRDDSFLNIGSPSNLDNEMHRHQEDFRRFSIDSTMTSRSAGQASSTMSQVAPSFNRFNTISENDCEEPSNQEKFLMLDNSQVQLNRLSMLQARNQQTKPHLKSSYALESLLPAVTEKQVRGDKENAPSRVNFFFLIFLV